MKAVVRHPSLRWILGAVVGYCFLILSTTADAHHRPVKLTEVGIVSKATSPQARPDGTRDTITLYSEQGTICPPNSKRAVYFNGATKQEIEGCYVIRDGKVHLGFVDGDNGVIPESVFVPVGGSAPQAAPPVSGNEKPGVGPGRDTNGTPRPVTPTEATRGGLKVA